MLKAIYRTKAYLIFLLMIIQGFLQAQVEVIRSDNKIIIEGQVFYLHVVKAGQTLYSISQAYQVSEEDIGKENPGSGVALQTGQVIKIPVKPQSEKENKPSQITSTESSRLYEVKKGDTMFSIARQHSLTVEQLENANPEVINNQIIAGQYIRIPDPDSKLHSKDFIFHTVKKKETVYGISKLYGISEDSLRKHNPELERRHPSIGQVLRIPNMAVNHEVPVIQDSLLVYKVPVYDTTVIADTYKEFLDSETVFLVGSFNVAFLLPFNYRPFEAPELPEETDKKTREDIINLEQQSFLDDQMLSSRNILEFMEGSLLALDSLRNEGIKVNVYIYDTQKSPTRLREILNTQEFAKMDLIIGPFYSYNLEIISEYSFRNRIPVISPLSIDQKAIQGNPYLVQANTSYQTEFDRMADFAANYPEKNILLVHNADSLEPDKLLYLKDRLYERRAAKHPSDSMPIREVIFNHNSISLLSEDLEANLTKDTANLIIMPVTDEAFVSTVITQLYFQLKNFNITVLGMPHWSAFQNIDFMYFHQLSLAYFTPYYFSYDSADVKHFLKDFRNSFYAEPATLTKKGGSYAFLGYDLSYHFLKNYKTYGRRFFLHMNEKQGSDLMNDFYFLPTGDQGGFENVSLVLVRYYENLEITAQPCGVTENPADIP